MSPDRRYSCAWQPIRRRAMENAYVHIPNPEPGSAASMLGLRTWAEGAPTAGAGGASLRPVQSPLALRPRDQMRV